MVHDQDHALNQFDDAENLPVPMTGTGTDGLVCKTETGFERKPANNKKENGHNAENENS